MAARTRPLARRLRCSFHIWRPADVSYPLAIDCNEDETSTSVPTACGITSGCTRPETARSDLLCESTVFPWRFPAGYPKRYGDRSFHLPIRFVTRLEKRPVSWNDGTPANLLRSHRPTRVAPNPSDSGRGGVGNTGRSETSQHRLPDLPFVTVRPGEHLRRL